MPSIVKTLTERGKIHPPSFLPDNVMYETVMGSMAYGVSNDSSDYDVYGWCIPPKDMLFPHLRGEIPDFGQQIQRFRNWQQHHVVDESALGGKGREYDFSIYSIVRYFQLCMENNPNMIDSLFVPQTCVLHITHIGNMVRENRHIFLHKGCWPKFKGYSYSQLHKMGTKNPQTGSKRQNLRKKFGFDIKFAYHIVRLLSEVEQILIEGDLDLQEEGRREHMKAIRRGEVSEEDIRKWAASKELELEKIYTESKLPWGPNEEKIKQLLLACLEHHYGDLSSCVIETNDAVATLKEIDKILQKNRRAWQ